MVRCDSLLSYESQRFITLRNWKLAVTFRTLQLAVVAYIIVYQIVVKQGYQEYDNLVGVTSTKVKGTASAGSFGQQNFTFFDVYDLIPNPVEKDALFVMTNFFTTSGQTKTVCVGNDKATEGCSDAKPCLPGNYTANGIISNTTCVKASNSSSGFCQIYSWCPLETPNNFPTQYIMNGVAQWTIYLKVNVEYPNFEVTLSNTFNTSMPDKGLRPNENLFAIADLLDAADTSYDEVSQFGTIILGQINFNCDLNKGTSACKPDFSWTRLDTDSPGFNYRYTVTQPGQTTRDLVKAFGIRFLFDVYGIAGKFSIVPLLVAIGSGVGLLSVATLVCDFVLQKFLPDKERYLAEKYQPVAESGIPDFSPGDVLAINELANSQHLHMQNLAAQGGGGGGAAAGVNGSTNDDASSSSNPRLSGNSTSPYLALNENAKR